jgi:hypothetical protein
MAVPVAGAAIGSVMKAPRTAQRILSSSTTAKDDLAKMPKKLAPANESGFFSPTEAAALNLQRKSGTGQAFLNDIMKGENVKSDEIKAMGLDTFLKDKKNVTTAEVQDFIAQNKIKLGETVYGASLKLKPDELERLSYLVKENNKSPLGAIDDRLGEGTYTELIRLENIRDKSSVDSLYRQQKALELGAQQAKRAGDKAMADRLFTQANHMNARAEALDLQGAGIEKPTKFGSHALPGGENYREIVLTLPDPKDALMSQVKALGITKDKDKITVNDILQRGGSDKLADNWLKSSQGVYKTRHWDETNPISHLRVSDRVTDGKKTLLIDEVQSDWHQAGREQGYVDPNKKPFTVEADQYGVYRIKDANGQTFSPYVDGDQMSGFMTREAAENAMQNNMTRLPKSQGVPDAPYKDDWYQLTLRRAIKEAIDGGYDRVALPTGQRVAERFDLSKQISEVHYSGSNLKAYDLDGNEVISQTGVKSEDLPSYIGKETANKLLEQPKQGTLRSLVGQDLKVGGEGMKKYYDEIYPGYLKKFGKKYGAEVGKTTTPTEYARDAQGIPSMYPTQEPLFYMDITPKMREEFSTGIPMKDGGEVLKGGIGSMPTK